MTCYTAEFYKTKKAFREACEASEQDGRQGCSKVWVTDPSIVRPRQFATVDMREGQTEVVTNHPKRSWFAEVTRKQGRLVVL